ncbi:MAG: SDR family NAD(P)-dependent oxidoreductase [Anaerocolumna sp.]
MACKEKTAIITGAAGNGMGRSVALTLAREGIAVVVNYLKNQEGAEAIAEHIKDNGGKAIAEQGNVFIKADCERLVQTTLDYFGKVDICIIGPGANWNPESLTNLNQDSAIQDVDQEISPIYNLLPLVLKDMEKRKWGRIIGIASNMDIPSPSYSYNAAKSARIEALKLAVNEAWKMGVTVNIIGPGPVGEIPSMEEACTYCRHEKKWLDRNKVTPQDIAEGVAFLCSDSAKYITGCMLPYLF